MTSFARVHCQPSEEESKITVRLLPGIVFFILTVFEFFLVVAVVRGEMTIWFALASHLSFTAFSALTLMRLSGCVEAGLAIGILATLLTGPFGAGGTLGLIIRMQFAQEGLHGIDLASWYKRLSGRDNRDLATRIHDDLIDGRGMRREVTDVPNLMLVLSTADLPTKQAMLGFIGLNYHSDFRPVLLHALASSDAIVRVQAAAVFAKLRESFKARAKVCLSKKLGSEVDSHDLKDALELVEELRACLTSGFLDQSEKRAVEQAATNACAMVLSTGECDKTTELQALHALADAGGHKKIRDHLQNRAWKLDSELRRLYLDALMQLGDLRELAAIVKHHAWSAEQQKTISSRTPVYQIMGRDQQAVVSLDDRN